MKRLASLLLGLTFAYSSWGASQPATDSTPQVFSNKGMTAASNTFRNPWLPANRVVLFGDSHFGLGWNSQPLPTTAGSFVVSGGVATITNSGNVYMPAGNYVLLYNVNEAAMGSVLNGVFVPVLSQPSNTSFTVSATINGATMANGDYSSSLGGAWQFAPFTYSTDSSFYRLLNQAAGNPVQIVGEFGMVGANTTQILAVQNKLLSGTKLNSLNFDIAVVDGGSNDFNNGTVFTVATANQKMQAAYQNMVSVVTAFQNAGKRVVLVIPPPSYSGGPNPAISNSAAITYRKQLLQFAQSTMGVAVIDLFKDTVDGTSTVGSMLTNCTNGADNVHLSSLCNYQIGGYESAGLLTSMAVNTLSTETVSVLDDSITYSTSNAVAAWATGQTYTVPLLLANSGYLYQLTTAGVGTTSVAPTCSAGTCQGADGYLWTFAGVDSRNLIAHGLMDGTGGTNNGSTNYGSSGTAAVPIGSPQVPTGWIANNPTNCTGILLSQQTLSRTGANSPKWGYGWNANLNFTGAGTCSFGTSDDFSGFVPGHWYRAGITITALANFSNIKALWLTVTPPIVVGFSQIYVNRNGNNTTTLPMLNGDVRQIWSEAFYVPPGATTDLGNSTLLVQIDSAGVGTANFQQSNAFVKQVINPYSY